MTRSGRGRAALALILAAASWGIGTVLSKRAVAELPPVTLLAAQLIVSVVVLGVAVLACREPIGAIDRRIALLGALNPAIAYGLSLYGLTLVSASLSVLVWASEPLLILLLATLLLGERPGLRVGLLSAVALSGLTLVLSGPAGTSASIGLVATVLGVACCAVYSVATRAWIGDSPSTLGVVFTQQVVAAAVVLVALPVSLDRAPLVPAGVTPAGMASVAASGVLYYGAAYLLYLSALRHLPVSIAAVSFYLVPLFGVAAALVAGERLVPIQSIGAVVTILAVLSVGLVQARSPAAPS